MLGARCLYFPSSLRGNPQSQAPEPGDASVLLAGASFSGTSPLLNAEGACKGGRLGRVGVLGWLPAWLGDRCTEASVSIQGRF